MGGCGHANMVFSDVWFLNVESWTWYEISVNNSIYAAPQLWSHPAVKIDQTVVVFPCPVTSTVNSAAASLITGVPQALMKMYSLDYSELETSRKCSWRADLSNNKSLPASSLHSVNVCEDMILIFGGLSDEQTVQTANNTIVFVTPFWTD
ncbi:F-box only 42 [Paramuricea clavata]|uniref:F-box only 42 n=1 Tax=Paramuricea clavata TaxID=317549 RepID=A0A6S7JCN5_PARCT|nr:F-box only 42 [Paramuricea clavata]